MVFHMIIFFLETHQKTTIYRKEIKDIRNFYIATQTSDLQNTIYHFNLNKKIRFFYVFFNKKF